MSSQDLTTRRRVRAAVGRRSLRKVAARIDLPLACIVIAGAAFSAFWTARVAEWGLMTDELLYMKLAVHIGDTLSPLPAVRDAYYAQLTPVYPALLAPLVRFLSTPAAFHAAHVLNSLLMASAAIPAYLLARAIGVSRGAGYCAAALTVAVPWIVYGNMLLTETAAYPIFGWASFAIVRATTSPSPRHDAAAIALIVLAIATRTQFVVLGAVFVLAVVLHELGYRVAEPRERRAAERAGPTARRLAYEHRVLVVTVATALVGLALVALTVGLNRSVGQYGNTLTGDLLPHGISRSFRAHLAVVAVNVALLPLVLSIAWGLATVLRPRAKADHAFAVFLALTVLLVVLEAASVNARTIGLIQERYAFYIVPLLFIAMVAYLGRPRYPAPALAAGALVTLWLLAKFDYGYQNGYSFVSPFYAVIEGRTHDVGTVLGFDHLDPGSLISVLAVVGTVLVFIATRKAPAKARVVGVSAAVLAYCVMATAYDFHKLRPTQSAGQARLGLDTPLERQRGLNWVDDVLPSGAKAAFAPAVVSDIAVTRKAWWDLEFWNKSVTRMYNYEPAWREGTFPTEKLTLDPRSGALSVQTPLPYLVVPRYDRRFAPEGRTIATTSLLALVQAPRPLRAAWATSGTDQDGWTTAGKPAVVRLFPSRPGQSRRTDVTLQLTSSPFITGARAFRVAGGERPVRGLVPSKLSREVTVPACVRGNQSTDLVIRVRGSATLPGGRQVGLALTRVVERPAGRCGPG